MRAFVDTYYVKVKDLYSNSVMHKTQTPPKTNCPNCGAPLENGKCSYCGTKVICDCQDATNARAIEREAMQLEWSKNTQSTITNKVIAQEIAENL